MKQINKSKIVNIIFVVMITIQLSACKDKDSITEINTNNTEISINEESNNKDSNNKDNSNKDQDYISQPYSEKEINTQNNINIDDSTKDKKDENGEVNNSENKKELTSKIFVYTKEANIGSFVHIEIFDDNSLNDIKYYQIFKDVKPISNITKLEESTVIYPAQEENTEVIVKLFNDKNEIIESVNTKLIKNDY